MTLPPAPADAYGYSNTPPPAARRFNGLGLASLIVGIFAVLFSVFPFVGVFGGVLAVAGLILGIIGLVLKNRGKGLAIAGTIISAIALILAIVLGIAYTAAFVSAANKITDNGAAVAPAQPGGPSTAPKPGQGSTGAGTSRTSPAPFGSTVTLKEFGSPQWDVTMGQASFDVTADVKAANQFNDDPPAGQTYVRVPVTLTYSGKDAGDPFLLDIEYVGADGRAYKATPFIAGIDGMLTDIDNLYTGSTATGDLYFMVPDSGHDAAVWSVATFLSDPAFVKVQ